jgi:hypothetical protein
MNRNFGKFRFRQNFSFGRSLAGICVYVCTLDKQFVIRLLASITERGKEGVDKRKNANIFRLFFPQVVLSVEVNSQKMV